MRVFVRDLNDKEYILDLQAKDTILNAKLAIQKATGVPPDQQRLMYSGEVLVDNGHFLEYYSISIDSTLHFLPKTQETSLDSLHRSTGRPFPGEPFLSRSVDANEHLYDVGYHVGPRAHESLLRPAWSPSNDYTSRQTGVDESFDEDQYILDPQAHFEGLKVLERETVEGSEFYQLGGRYYISETQAFSGKESKKIRNIPDHLRICLGSLSWNPAPSGLRTTIDGPEKASEENWQKDRRTLAHLCQSYFMICRVLQKFDFLQASKFCSSYFSVLRLHTGTDVAEIVKLRASLVKDIKVDLEAVIKLIIDDIGLVGSQPFAWGYLEGSCIIFLENAGVLVPLGQRARSREIPSIMTLCRMIAAFLDLALVSYVGSHGSPFCAKFLRQDIQEVEVQGISETDLGFRCSMLPLACLHGFLDQKKAWVFQINPGRQLPTRLQTRVPAQLSVLARMKDFADIWGPVWTIPAERGQIKQYNVSKGVICRVGKRTKFSAVQCHWYSWASYHRRRLFSSSGDLLLAEDDLLLIGAVFRQNYNCRYTLDDYETEYGRNMGVLGTTPSYWKADSRGFSFGLSKIVGVTVSGSQKLIPHTSVKQHILDKWTNNPARANPGVLNQYLALEISNCTGNARRISLKALLLLSTVSPLLERQIPGWNSTHWGSRFLAALHTTNTQAIFDVWKDFPRSREQMAELFCCVLEVLNTTGCGNDHFDAGFLHGGQESSVSLDYERNSWAEIVEDSHLTAVYAVINDVCLECQVPNHSAMTCTGSDAYTVLQTQFRVDAVNRIHENDRISVSPYRRIYQRADAGCDRVSLFKPESRRFFTLSRFSALKASEVRDQWHSDFDFYFRASSRGYHGRKLPRRCQITPAPRLVAVREARDAPAFAAVRGVMYERRPAAQPEHAPPVVPVDYNDRDRRLHQRVIHCAHAPTRYGAEAAEDCDPEDGANSVLHGLKNCAIEDDIDDLAPRYESPYEEPRIEYRSRRVVRHRIDDAVLGPRDYARQVR